MNNTKSFIKILNISRIAYKLYINDILKCANEYNISFKEADVLLFFSINRECCNARDVVKARHVSKAYVSKAINSLLEKGYISVIVDSNDKRYQRINVNDSAKDIVNSLKLRHRKFKESLTNNISDEEKNIFLKVLDQMENNILDMEEKNV